MAKMTLAAVTHGKIMAPIRVLIYGIHGCGKTTFAADAPDPVGLCAEDGTAQIDCHRFPEPKNLGDIAEAVNVLASESHSYRTLFVDTLDWLEPMVWADVCANGVKGKKFGHIDDIGYGKGYNLAADRWRTLVKLFDRVRQPPPPGVNRARMNVILVSHASVVKVDDPVNGKFDRYAPKLHPKSAAVVLEWVDAALFARHEAHSTKDGLKTRGSSTGERVIHTRWSHAYDAKNRFDLPDQIPLSWEAFEECVKASEADSVPALLRKIESSARKLPTDRMAKIPGALEACGTNVSKLSTLLNKILAEVSIAEQEAAREDSPEQAAADVDARNEEAIGLADKMLGDD